MVCALRVVYWVVTASVDPQRPLFVGAHAEEARVVCPGWLHQKATCWPMVYQASGERGVVYRVDWAARS